LKFALRPQCPLRVLLLADQGAGRSRAKALDVFDLDEETEQLTGASKYSNVGEDAKLASLDKELEGL